MSAAVAVGGASPRARRRRVLWARFLRRPAAVGSLVVIVAFVLTGTFAPLIAPADPAAVDFDNLLANPSWQHLFGTDEFGRDVFSRAVWGARTSIQVGVLATMIGMLIAVPLGLAAGYCRGWPDAVIARTTDVVIAFPDIILLIAVVAFVGPSLVTMTVAIGIGAVPGMLRITRGETMALREADFVPAAFANGAGGARVVFRHILPNLSGTLIVVATFVIPRAIIAEAALSFLGLGMRPPGASWGIMLHDAQSYRDQAPYLAIFPGLAIVLAALAFNLLGDGLRDVFDPRTAR